MTDVLSDAKGLLETWNVQSIAEDIKNSYDREAMTHLVRLFHSLITTIESQKLELTRLQILEKCDCGDCEHYKEQIESQKEEIEKLHKIIEKEDNVRMRNLEFAVEIESLKAITELKNEEIQGLKNVIEREQHYANTLDADLKKQTSITELAVKGLGEIKMMLDMDHSGFQKYQIWKSAFDTLSEIERLSQ